MKAINGIFAVVKLRRENSAGRYCCADRQEVMWSEGHICNDV